MTPEQRVFLKADLLARAQAGEPFATWLPERRDDLMSVWYNEASTFIVWRRNVTEDEFVQNGFAWNEVDGLSVGKARIWDWMFRGDRRQDFGKQNVRDGIVNVWSGTAGKLAVQAAIFAHAKRAATHAETLFTVTTETDLGTTAAPGLLGIFEGEIVPMDIAYALDNA